MTTVYSLAGTSMSDSLSDRLLKMVKEVLPEVLVVAANCLEIGSFIGEGTNSSVVAVMHLTDGQRQSRSRRHHL